MTLKLAPTTAGKEAPPPGPKLTRAQHAALEQLDSLDALSMREVKELWPKYFKVAPFSIKRAILVPCLAYRIQEEAFGGLSRSARSRLEAVSEAWAEGRRPTIAPAPKSRVRPGTRLLRSWRGDVHEVTVLDEGFLYREKTYTSLSEIARAITGVQWSGPLFFGVKKTQDRLRSTKAAGR